MHRLRPVYLRGRKDGGLCGLREKGQLGFGADEVDVGQEGVRSNEGGDVRTNLFR